MLGIDVEPWVALEKEMRASGKFNPRGLEWRQLLRDCLRGLAVVGWSKAYDRILAYGVVERSKLSDTFQVRKLFVGEDQRRNGNGSAVINNIVQRLLLIPVCGSPSYFALTDSAKIVQVLETNHFKKVTTDSMPDVGIWAKLAGVYDRLPAALRNEKADGRHLLMRPP